MNLRAGLFLAGISVCAVNPVIANTILFSHDFSGSLSAPQQVADGVGFSFSALAARNSLADADPYGDATSFEVAGDGLDIASDIGGFLGSSTQNSPPSGASDIGFADGDEISVLLTGLPTDQELTVSFDLLVLNSADGNGNANGFAGPDGLLVSLNGETVLDATFSNVAGRDQGYTSATPLGAATPVQAGTDADFSGVPSFVASINTAFDALAIYRDLTFVTVAPGGVLDLSFIAPTSAPSWDESFGIDNIVVSFEAPAPAVMPLPMVAPLLLVGALVGRFAGRRP